VRRHRRGRPRSAERLSRANALSPVPSVRRGRYSRRN
jgi:hypothetical protein